MKRKILLAITAFSFVAATQAQTLDRISLSAGGTTGDDVNFVLGETFNFALAKDGNISLETGSLASEQNTGADNNFTVVKEFAQNKPLACYPNPTTDVLTINYSTNETLTIISVYDISGKIVKMQSSKIQNQAELQVNDLSPGTYFISVTDNQFKIIGYAKFIKK